MKLPAARARDRVLVSRMISTSLVLMGRVWRDSPMGAVSGHGAGQFQQFGTDVEVGVPGRPGVDLQLDLAGFGVEPDHAAVAGEAVPVADGEHGAARQPLDDIPPAVLGADRKST